MLARQAPEETLGSLGVGVGSATPALGTSSGAHAFIHLLTHSPHTRPHGFGQQDPTCWQKEHPKGAPRPPRWTPWRGGGLGGGVQGFLEGEKEWAWLARNWGGGK